MWIKADWERRTKLLEQSVDEPTATTEQLATNQCGCLHAVAASSCRGLWFVFSPQGLNSFSAAHFKRCRKINSAAFIHHETIVFKVSLDVIYWFCFQTEEEMLAVKSQKTTTKHKFVPFHAFMFV